MDPVPTKGTVADAMNQQSSFLAVMDRLSAGDDDAARRVFQRFARDLVAQAKAQLGGALRLKVDPEDAVQSAFRSFFSRQADGKFNLAGWDNLWALLLSITIRKCINLRRHYRCDRRDVGREVAGGLDPAEEAIGWEALDREPTPEEAALLADDLTHLVHGLSERDCRIVELRLQDYTPIEISARVGCAERTVFRVLHRVKDRLDQMDRSAP